MIPQLTIPGVVKLVCTCASVVRQQDVWNLDVLYELEKEASDLRVWLPKWGGAAIIEMEIERVYI